MANFEIEKIEGRKIYMKCEVVNKDHEIVADATSLFLTIKWGTIPSLS